jgi:integrase
LVRITEFPTGIVPPKRVRIYFRCDHYVLQWWDPAENKNLPERVDGDLVAAISRAREIDERLVHFKTSGKKRGQIRHRELVESFVTDLNRRADAGEIDPKTVVRYRSALDHYLNFSQQPGVETKYPSATNVDREFALRFAAFLADLQISPNGHPHTQKRRMASTRYVEDVARSMFHWATDPDRGNMLPDGFRNPFVGKNRKTTDVVPDPFGEPDVTLDMAVAFISSCDQFQLPLFALIALYGLRPSELSFLFRENAIEGWMNVVCDPALDYVSKGRRDKRLPMIDELSTLWMSATADDQQGLLFVRRRVAEQGESPPLRGASRDELRHKFAERCSRRKTLSAAERIRIRDQLLKEVGGIDYDHIDHEFRRLATQLNWPFSATMKDFRHLFATSLMNAGMPETYRRYLMGHSQGKASIMTYSHLNDLRRHYESAVQRELQPVVDAIVGRFEALEKPDVRMTSERQTP